MPSYPIESDKLLAAADLLCPDQAPRGRPPYTAHRRAVSTAYYAAFHAINERVAHAAFPTADAEFRQRVQRWIAHTDIRMVCEWVSTLQGTGSYGVPQHIRALLDPPGGPPHLDGDTVAIRPTRRSEGPSQS